MSDVLAYFGGGEAPRRFSVLLDGPNQNFHIDFDRISAKAVGNVDDACLDFLEIACAVFAADGAVTRGGSARAHFGERWRRGFEFKIPVVRLDIWGTEQMRAALADAVGFLTEDDVRFAFSRKTRLQNRQPYLIDDASAEPFPADDVILFSGGLDSLAGAIDRLETEKGRVVLVTHRSAQKAIPRQALLGSHLAKLYSGRVNHAQIRATRLRSKSGESTQRSRSFLFTALAYTFARIFAARRINFYENGITSHNLPISPQVVGSMATRTTHPAALRKLEHILDILADAIGHTRTELGNPFAWLTKTEVVKTLEKHGGAPLIRKAVSCTVVRKQSRSLTHCGACSQCIDRRFAVVAAALEDHDPAETYITDVFLGERLGEQSRTMALDWMRRSWEAADAGEMRFVADATSELVRIVGGLPEAMRGEALGKAFDLHRRQGLVVREALARMISLHARALVGRTLPPTSLLWMSLAEYDGTHIVSLAPRIRPEPSVDPETRKNGGSFVSDLLPLQVRFLRTSDGALVDVINLTTLNGRAADVAHALKLYFDEDRAEERAREDYRYAAPGMLALGSKSAVKVCVQRLRRQLATAYEQIELRPPAQHLLVQTKSPHGYRLDPAIHVVGAER